MASMSHPSNRMRRFAARWLTDEVRLSSVTVATDTRPIGKSARTVTTVADCVAAKVRQAAVGLVDDVTVRRNPRDLIVWVDESVTPTVGQRLTVTRCDGDSTLVDRYGEIVDVERDSVRTVRRCTVRIGNDD